MLRILSELARDEQGPTAIEYALVGALVSISVIAGLTIIGQALSNTLNTVGNQINAP